MSEPTNDAPGYDPLAIHAAARGTEPLTLADRDAEIDRLRSALQDSERKAITLDDVKKAMWRLQYDTRAGDDLWPAILQARDARLAAPTQETPDVTG